MKPTWRIHDGLIRVVLRSRCLSRSGPGSGSSSGGWTCGPGCPHNPVALLVDDDHSAQTLAHQGVHVAAEYLYFFYFTGTGKWIDESVENSCSTQAFLFYRKQ